MYIETHNLKLVPCNSEILRAAIQGNDTLAQNLDVSVQDNWTEFGVGALQYSLDRLAERRLNKKPNVLADTLAKSY